MKDANHNRRESTDRRQWPMSITVDCGNHEVTVQLTPEAEKRVTLSEIRASLINSDEIARAFDGENLEIRRFPGPLDSSDELTRLTADR